MSLPPLSREDETRLIEQLQSEGISLEKSYCADDYITLEPGMVVTDRNSAASYTLIETTYVKTSYYGGYMSWKIDAGERGIRNVPEKAIHLGCVGMIADTSLRKTHIGMSRILPTKIRILGLGAEPEGF